MAAMWALAVWMILVYVPCWMYEGDIVKEISRKFALELLISELSLLAAAFVAYLVLWIVFTIICGNRYPRRDDNQDLEKLVDATRHVFARKAYVGIDQWFRLHMAAAFLVIVLSVASLYFGVFRPITILGATLAILCGVSNVRSSQKGYQEQKAAFDTTFVDRPSRELGEPGNEE